MSYLLIDHRHTVDPTGTRDGVLQEWDCLHCPHCQAVIKKDIHGPCRTTVDSPGECDYCKKPVCHSCAARLIASEVCPGEMRVNIDRAWQQMMSAKSLVFAFRR